MHPTLLLLEFARRPTPQAEAARANYNRNVLCSKSLSSAAEDEAREGFNVEVSVDLQNRGAVAWLPTSIIYCPLLSILKSPWTPEKKTDEHSSTR